MPARTRKNKATKTDEQSEKQVNEDSEQQPKRRTKIQKKSSVKSVTKKNANKQKGGSKTDRTVKNKEEHRRYFKIVNEDGSSHGRYTGDTPKQAASKGYTKMIHKMKKSGEKLPKRSIIYLRESTRGSPKKIYGYEATRQKLDKPQELKIANSGTGESKTIKYKYRNKIKKVQVDMEQFGGVSKNNKSKKNVKKSESKKESTSNATKKKSKKKSKKTSNKKNHSGSKKDSAKAESTR